MTVLPNLTYPATPICLVNGGHCRTHQGHHPRTEAPGRTGLRWYVRMHRWVVVALPYSAVLIVGYVLGMVYGR